MMTSRREKLILISLLVALLVGLTVTYWPIVCLVFSLIAAPILIVQLSWIVVKIVQKLTSTPINPDGKAILITGCDSGFGHESALHLNQFGFRVIATCMLPDGEGAKKLKQKACKPEKMHIVGLDVTQKVDIDQVYRQVETILSKTNDSLYGLLNNAGIFNFQAIETGTFEAMLDKIMSVNFWGTVRMTRKFLPLIRASRGRIVTITSLASRYSKHSNGAYSCSKHAVKAFVNTCRIETAKFGVKFIEIEPGYADTPLMDNSKTLENFCQAIESTDESIRLAYRWDTKKLDRYTEKIMKTYRFLHVIFDAKNSLDKVVNTVGHSFGTSDPDDNYVVTGKIFRTLDTFGSYFTEELRSLISQDL
ncbi:retinol dehydrogenase 5-like [Brevipalpus obovatus]|uniref:retinol dehydrogenase 5-like n=1 Tax=Brevipalpus obovatus TaxID=246614 RepID=UPI003D9E1D51